MPDIPDELRDRAARAGHGVIFCGDPADSESDISWRQWLAIVDAVAGVLAEHQGETDKAFNDLCHEFNDAQDEIIVDLRADWESEKRWADHYHREAQEMRARARQLSTLLRGMARRLTQERRIGLEINAKDNARWRAAHERAEADLKHARELLGHAVLARSVSPDQEPHNE